MSHIDEYAQAAFEGALQEIISSILVNTQLSCVDDPRAILLGGQSGAGKTTLHLVYKKKLQGNIIVINGDEYRKLHPHFAEIQKRYGLDAPAHTAKWAGAMVEALIDAFSAEGYNLIVEGTLRTSSAPLKTADLLRSRGYDVSLALMAVKPEISLVSCQIRYEQMRIAGTTPRAVDPAHHAKIVEDIVENLATLERSGVFSSVSLYNRAGVCLFALNYSDETAVQDAPASQVLQDALFGPWTEEERTHYENLQAQLLALQSEAEGETRIR
ncbi:MAG: zeta toxin family protein [Eggerthellaceae bacterium]|nr:zeta toxin family protein [Eggerthellaceae bacterium]